MERIEYVPWKRRLESGNVVEGPPEESAAVDVFRPGKLGANIPFEVPFNDNVSYQNGGLLCRACKRLLAPRKAMLPFSGCAGALPRPVHGLDEA